MKIGMFAYMRLYVLVTLCSLLTPGMASQAQTRLYSWGTNSHLQLGSGSSASRKVPGNVKAPPGSSQLTGVAYIAVGQQHTVAVKSEGTVYTWGYNVSGQLGNNTTTLSLKPVQVLGAGANGVLTDITTAAAGTDHTVVRKANGTVWAWGGNGTGQIGDDTLTQRLTPVQVKGVGGVNFLMDIAGIAASGQYNLAVKTDGTLYAWGSNGSGNLGDNTTTTRKTPIQVHGPNDVGFLTDIAKVACGDFHSLALKTDGTVWAWGRNGEGQCGDNTQTQHKTPVQVLGPGGSGFLTGIVAIAAGTRWSLALKSDGTLYAWGQNSSGQLGDSTGTPRLTPTQVHGPGNVGFLTGIIAIAAGDDHALAIKSDGSAWGWGSNASGNIGDGANTLRLTPVQVKGPNNVGFFLNTAMSAGGVSHSALLKSDGTVWCTGGNNNGQLGNDTTTNSNTPTQVISPAGLDIFPDAKAVVTGRQHTVVLTNRGTVYAFGDNSSGQLGDNTTTNRSVAVQTLGPGAAGILTDIIAIAAGDFHTVALKGDGTVWAWGNNNTGRLGDNTQTQRNTPVQVHGVNNITELRNIVAVAAGGDFTLALRRDGSVFGWGSNLSGQLGTGMPGTTFTPLQMLDGNGSGPLRNIVGIAAGNAHTLALGANGSVFACGQNSQGQLGDGTTADRSLPVRVLSVGGAGTLNSMASLAAGNSHSLALSFDGTVYAWGDNISGQLGDNTTNDSLTPVRVTGVGGTGLLTDVAALAAGRQHTLAVKFDGTVWAWGYNGQGEIGDNTFDSRPAPVQVLGPDGVGLLSSIITVAAGGDHSVVINGQGAVQGNVILQNSACSGIPIRFQFRPTGPGTPLERTILAGPLGLFTFTDIPPGEYDIAVKGSKWLQRVVHVNTISNNILNLRIFLLTGDANDDNFVDVFDLDQLIQAFNSVEGEANWNMNADFNCDDAVDVFDLDLLIQNFNLEGDA